VRESREVFWAGDHERNRNFRKPTLQCPQNFGSTSSDTVETNPPHPFEIILPEKESTVGF